MVNRSEQREVYKRPPFLCLVSIDVAGCCILKSAGLCTDDWNRIGCLFVNDFPNVLQPILHRCRKSSDIRVYSGRWCFHAAVLVSWSLW